MSTTRVCRVHVFFFNAMDMTSVGTLVFHPERASSPKPRLCGESSLKPRLRGEDCPSK